MDSDRETGVLSVVVTPDGRDQGRVDGLLLLYIFSIDSHNGSLRLLDLNVALYAEVRIKESKTREHLTHRNIKQGPQPGE